MKAIYLFALMCLLTGFVYGQQTGSQLAAPCITKQMADSVNATNLLKLSAINPVFIDWYVYEGQTINYPGPANIVNYIYIRTEDDCPGK